MPGPLSLRPDVLGSNVLAWVLGALSIHATSALAQQDSEIEEILVTGSYIAGTPEDAPSPVESIDRADIDAQGAAAVWDVIRNLNVNSGSTTNPGSGDAAQVAGTANINLRNLGANSTLTLINGRRMVPAAANTNTGQEYVDINSIPMVMTERMEVLTDGGSALYGSDAVAGVVNMIMRTDFEGLELYADMQGVEAASGDYEKNASAIWGWASDSGNTNLVLSAEWFERDPVSVEHANFYDRAEFRGAVGSVPTQVTGVGSGLVPVAHADDPNWHPTNSPTSSTIANPAYINSDVTAQNLANGGDGDTYLTDPLCDGPVGSRSDNRGERSGACQEDTSEWEYIAYGAERNSFAGSLEHMLDDGTELYSFFQYADSETQRADDGFNQARGPTVFLAPAGANQAGMSLGSYAAVAGNTAPGRGAHSNNPNNLSNGGLDQPFWAPVRDGWPRNGGDDNVTRTKTAAMQLGLNGAFELAGNSYDYDLGYSLSTSSLEQDYRTFNRQRAELAVNGLGGPNCTPNGISDFDFQNQPGLWDSQYGNSFTQTFFPGFVFTTRESISQALTSNNHGEDGCMFYNPYLTSTTDSDLANDPELMEWMNPLVRRTDKRNKLGVFDAVVSGEMFDMAGGMAQFALGAQYRDRNAKSNANRLNEPGIPDAILGYDGSGTPDEFHYVSNNFECSLCSFNYDHDRTVSASFLELSLPFLESVESQVAFRWEDYGGNIGSDVTSKFAISWRPVDSVLLRTSYSQSFRAPNINMIHEGLESGAATFRDPLRNQAVRAGVAEPTNANAEPNSTYTVGMPAPDVGNETADTFNMGFQWEPLEGALEGFSVGADFWRFEVEDRVLPQPAISAIEHELEAFEQAKQDPSNYVINETLETGTPAACDPNDPTSYDDGDPSTDNDRTRCVVDPEAYRVEGVVRSAQSSDASLTTISVGAINAGTITSDGVDFNTGYRWDSDWGVFSVNLDYTYVNQYTLSDVPGLELGLLETGVFDAAGTTGDGDLVESLPDHKGTLTFNWMYDNHAVNLINRYIGSYENLNYDNQWATATDEVRQLLSRKVDSYSRWDLQYNYRHNWSEDNWGTTTFTLGALDLFDEDIPYLETGSLNYDATVFDGRGRRIYARVLLQF